MKYNDELSKTKTEGDCFRSKGPKALCQIITYGWAVGADRVHFFPEDTGYPIGGDTDYKYFVVEVHYDNPERKIGFFDDLTLRFHATSKLRKNELGVMTFGTNANKKSILVPPDVERYTISTQCYSDCTSLVIWKQNSFFPIKFLNLLIQSIRFKASSTDHSRFGNTAHTFRFVCYLFYNINKKNFKNFS